MLRARASGDGDRPRGGRRRHRRRPGAHRQHLDDGRRGRRGGRACRWSSTATGPRRRPCGAADVLEALGVAIDLPPDAVAAVRRARSASGSASRRCSTRPCGTPAGAARELGVPTVFNFLGPLTNPAQPRRRRGRVRRRAAGAGAWPRCSPAAAASRAGRARRRRARRADHHHHEHRVGGRRRRGPAREPSTRRRSAWPRPTRRRPARRRRRGQRRRRSARVLAGERGPVRGRGAAQRRGRAGRVRRRGGRDRLPTWRRVRGRLERAAAAIDSGAASGVLARWVALCEPGCAAPPTRRPGLAVRSPGRRRTSPRCRPVTTSGTRCGCRCGAPRRPC